MDGSLDGGEHFQFNKWLLYYSDLVEPDSFVLHAKDFRKNKTDRLGDFKTYLWNDEQRKMEAMHKELNILVSGVCSAIRQFLNPIFRF